MTAMLAASSACGARSELIDQPPVTTGIPVETVRVGESRTGRFEAGDMPSIRRNSGGQRVEDVERLRLDAGQIVTLLLCGGTNSDVFLIVTRYQGDGTILEQDDDSANGLNSRIVFTAPESGVYELHLTTFADRVPTGTGADYTLIVRDGSQPMATCP